MQIEPKKIKASDIFQNNPVFHIARVEQGAYHKNFHFHTHDFVEVFWIERGRGIHHINGQQCPLNTGDVVMIRAHDQHGFQKHRMSNFTMVNVAFQISYLKRITSHYFKDSSSPWHNAPMPTTYIANQVVLSNLTHWSQRLANGPQSPLLFDAFLCDLLFQLTDAPAPSTTGNMPTWLYDATAQFSQGVNLERGVDGLCHLANRCPAHVNRMVRKHFGVTATKWVNTQRIQYAARELRMTSTPIITISQNGGFENLSYFYRIFKQAFSLSPRQYRLREQAPIQKI